jgi:hypothetical protein
MALIITGFIFSPTLSRAASITLAWSPSPTPTVVGYELFYGLASEDYSDAVDAGTNLSITLWLMIPRGTAVCFRTRSFKIPGPMRAKRRP